ETQQARQKLLDSPVEVSLLDLLGIPANQQQQVRESLSSLFASTQQIIAQNIALQQQEVQAQISATDEIIADRRRRVDELEAQLEQEIALQREGLASNVDAVREEIALRKEQERQAVEDKRRALEEQKKLARQQIAIDSAA